MTVSQDKLIIYLKNTVNGIYKILPLFEEKNIGVDTYVDSLLFTLYSLDEVVDVKYGDEYITVLATLESVKKEIVKPGANHSVVKREIFKSINIVKNMIDKLEGEKQK